MRSLPPILRRVFAFVSRRASEWRARRSRRHSQYSAEAPPNVQPHADERTIRRIAEDELGGKSSSESREAYLRGDNPGGLHQGGHGPAPRERGVEDKQ
jgi:hypothetical protein